MFRHVLMLAAACSFACCTVSPTVSLENTQRAKTSEVKLKAQDVVSQCVTPHEAFGFPPQAVPGIPVLVARHAECLGQPNILVAIWPGSKDRVNLLYVEMLMERYVMHLEEVGEYYDIDLHDVDQVIVDKDAEETPTVPAFAAVYKLVHKVSDPAK